MAAPQQAASAQQEPLGLPVERRPGHGAQVSFAERPSRSGPICPRCNVREKSVELIFQARTLRRPKPGSLATRGKRLCEQCALEVFEAAEALMDGRESA